MSSEAQFNMILIASSLSHDPYQLCLLKGPPSRHALKVSINPNADTILYWETREMREMRDWEGDLGGLVEGDNEDRDHDVEQHEGRDGGKRNEVDLCSIVSVAMSGMSDMSAIDIAMYGTGAFHAEGKWARGYETGRQRGAQGRGLRQGALHLRQPGGSASGSTWRSVVRVIVERPAVHHLGCLCPTCALSHPQIAARRLALRDTLAL